ncbi:uroporphyrinogen-III C-methyltransferase [Allocoleopsis franciscana]|uniref:uroporphyrinogen-III C-methyltransferase n=1 Tax=Allocoleopsis franciscana PCC 7113 TaxID=1173027 RepID=K9WCF5_9CYAN|nr:uroporphyrinogen-III C-methyltransferase [Allocoleopsis franciscana]AFZ17444.1 uroporphyrin-III C-methyltransferase [Allocoleopsis franciscana PCC 7113]
MGKVYLVGAGPGNIEYLTIRAQQLLEQAEVLIYDALVDERLLTLVPPNCIQFDMGKRGGRPSPSQSEINQLMVEQCRQGKQVVRLKSGDPFIFGRATSEILSLQEANCPFEVVPGISSALAAPLLAGIPLTDTVLSRGFAVVSAHEPEELDWEALARLETVVILMGTRHLGEIVKQLQRHKRSPSSPIAVIRDCGRPEQQVWVGTLKDIVKQTTGISLSPAVIVIGEVVGLRDYLQSPSEPEVPSSPEVVIGEELRVEAWDVKPLPELKVDTSPGEELPVLNLEQWNVEPSPELNDDTLPPEESPGFNVAQWDVKPLPELKVDNPPPEESPDLTIEQLNIEISQALEVNPLPVEPSPENLQPVNLQPVNLQLDNVQPSPLTPSLPLTGKTVLVTRSAGQSSHFSYLLQQEGAEVIEMPALVITPPSSWEELDHAIAQLYNFDWLILTSSNGVEYFFERLHAQGKTNRALGTVQIAVVGKKTAASLKAHGLEPDFIPPNFVADSLVEHFPEPLEGKSILFPRVESGGRDVLVKQITAQGAEVTEVAAYESGCPAQMAPAAKTALQQQRVDIITFASSKTVKHFVQLLETSLPEDAPGLPIAQSRLENVCVASIGPQTSITCRQLLGRVDVEAQEYTLEGLIQAIVQWTTDRY